ncbi:aldose 1-epimerase family protein [Levilactobacillus brevis]|jgi:galactose mutarotase-like enzyme|uniref:Galactose mutarotase related enzyme n=3 Tax=Levilactobacillus brevis TaxID=1580 RepID=Q03U12_LEVBA|nr:aldose 1-epimerase family protein [Levilactobacillus brevis]ABJ63310.1 Galactose mutarotase related enzyme [Levilactobacillus brevis ATCC 367]KLE30582.1 galactose mutarotase [Levilactobacillus brevis]KWT47759.1 galactose mutarotase [Levilactobacillus brevis]KWU30506.1 galactose mutarotase [Levilactobacillus brevis]MBX6948655.1 aldose 1-epimerase family protein [Levilactobacillus brevis]
MVTIQNDRFTATINEVGAELTHLVDQASHRDLIWNNDLWPKHAPVLFPAIGRSNEDSYLIDGQRYEMPQHGFVSGETFMIVDQTPTAVTLSLTANAATRVYYPFYFELQVTFTLVATGLNLTFSVQNHGQQDLSYSLGSHPAFNVPFEAGEAFTDYELVLDPAPTDLQQFEIVKTPNPYRSGKELPVTTDKGVIKLNYPMFDAGLIILKAPNLAHLTLQSTKSKHSISLNLDDFDYVTLWTKEGAQAPFLCLEPFNGLPDVAGDLRELATKEGNHHVAVGQSETMAYTITVD